MKNQSSALFIASEIDQIRHLLWRVKLIHSLEIYPAEKLVPLLRRINKGSSKPLPLKERQEFSKLAINKKYDIDEFDQAVLFTIALLKNPSGISNEVAIKTDRIMNFKFKMYNGAIEDFASDADIKSALEYRKLSLKKYADDLISIDGARIRAYLAFKEIAALFDPDTMIPHLVGITPKYLASPLTQKWIFKQQHNSKYGKNKTEIIEATSNLLLLSKAITGDKRKNKKRERPYWKLGFIYDDLVRYIDGFRRQQIENNIDHQFFEMYCADRKIPKQLKKLILAMSPTSSELAIEIMINNELIKSEKTFREIQPKLNLIQKRHFQGNILGIASDIRPLVFDFIDIPGTNPEIISGIDQFKYLELVEIPKP